jgi:hypothetical protein
MNSIEKYEDESVPISICYKNRIYNGKARPLSTSCTEDVCFELDVTLNGKEMGTIHCTKAGWTMEKVPDQQLVNAIGENIMLWYE